MDLAQGWLLASSIYTEDKFRPIETAVAPMTLFLLGEMVKSMTPTMAQFARLRLPGKPGYTFIIMAVSRSTEQGPELNESPGCFIHAGGPLPFLSASIETGFTDRTGSRKQLSVYLFTNLFLQGGRLSVSPCLPPHCLHQQL